MTTADATRSDPPTLFEVQKAIFTSPAEPSPFAERQQAIVDRESSSTDWRGTATSHS